MASQSASWWQGGKGRWPLSGEKLTPCLRKGVEPTQSNVGEEHLRGGGARGKGLQLLCSLYFSDVKNKPYLHPGGGRAYRVLGAVWGVCGEWAGPPCTTLPQVCVRLFLTVTGSWGGAGTDCSWLLVSLHWPLAISLGLRLDCRGERDRKQKMLTLGAARMQRDRGRMETRHALYCF